MFESLYLYISLFQSHRNSRSQPITTSIYNPIPPTSSTPSISLRPSGNFKTKDLLYHITICFYDTGKDVAKNLQDNFPKNRRISLIEVKNDVDVIVEEQQKNEKMVSS